MNRIQGIVAVTCMAGSCAAQAGQAAPNAGDWWFEVGLGAAQLETGQSAPVGGERSGLVWTLGGGRHLTPQWGIGAEIGAARVESFFTCGADVCVATDADLARGKEFDHFLLITEFRPSPQSGWRFGAGVGLMQYCYGQNLNAECQTLSSVGGQLTGGYDWPVGRFGKVGLRLAAEAASFPARPSNGIAAFQYSAVRLSVNWTSF